MKTENKWCLFTLAFMIYVTLRIMLTEPTETCRDWLFICGTCLYIVTWFKAVIDGYFK